MAVVLRRSTSDPLVSQQAFNATCTAGDYVGNFVSVAGQAIGGVYQVISADITNSYTMPAIGMIISKTSANTCIVQRFGSAYTNLSSLTAGKRCFVGYDSKPTLTPPNPTLSSSGYCVVQSVGVAVSVDTIEIIPNINIIKVR